jgi:hypothetical protein
MQREIKRVIMALAFMVLYLQEVGLPGPAQGFTVYRTAALVASKIRGELQEIARMTGQQ